MANWASTAYAIEGPKEVLQKIEQALLHPILELDEGDNWEGGVLRALNIDWKPNTPDGRWYCMRGFISGEPWWDKDDTVLRFEAEEAWGATDFHEVLDKNLPVKTYYVVEECGEEIYATNDKEGKYFPERYWVDTCIDGNYQSDYFVTKESMYEWLSKITYGRVKCAEDVEEFNSDYEDSGTDDENFINIHKFEIVE